MIFFLIVFQLNATNQKKFLKNGIGFVAVVNPSSGFSYLRIGDTHGFQITGSYSEEKEKNIKNKNLNIGLFYHRMLQRSLSGNDKELYIFSGMSYFRNYKEYYEEIYDSNEYRITSTKYNNHFYIGAGFGFRLNLKMWFPIPFFSNYSLGLELPYRACIHEDSFELKVDYPQISLHIMF
jgi:hypothetical protein